MVYLVFLYGLSLLFKSIVLHYFLALSKKILLLVLDAYLTEFAAMQGPIPFYVLGWLECVLGRRCTVD
jgi:hypothetical protein